MVVYTITDLFAVFKSAFASAAAWLTGLSSVATTTTTAPSTSTATVTVAVRLESLEARLDALHQKAYAAAHAIAATKHKYALPTPPKNPRDAAKVCNRASRFEPKVTSLAPTSNVPYVTARDEMQRIGHRLMTIAGAIEHESEAFVLEKTLAEWERVLPSLPGFVDECKLAQAAWLADNAADNDKALRLLRSSIPVDVARLSEDELAALRTPSGRVFPEKLAFRLKDSPIVQLVREDAKLIERMHPSVLRRLSTFGLTLVERRALFQVLQAPAHAWGCQLKHQPSAEVSAKLDWHQQLVDDLVRRTSSDRALVCDLYDHDLGFPVEGCTASDVTMHGLL